MNRSSFLLVSSLLLLTNSAIAGTMGPVVPPSWNWVAALSLGPVWENAGKTQTIAITPDIEQTFVAYQNSKALFDGEVFLGLQKPLTPMLVGQLGVAIGFTSNASLSGAIWDDASLEFNNHVYQYKIQNTHIAAKGKILFDNGYWLIPWFSGSVGVGFNDAHAYVNTPTIYEALPDPNFSTHTKTAFTYTLGAGVQKILNPHWQVGAGYEFADWGKSNLGPAQGQTTNSGIALNHLYTNGVLFNITYIS